MNFNYNVWYVDQWGHAHNTYSGEDRESALNQYKLERKNQGYAELVYFMVRSRSSIMKGKQGIMLTYYKHTEFLGGELIRTLKQW